MAKTKSWDPPKKHPHTDKGEREFDETSLREGSHGRYVHRDYAAHWFRWQHSLRFVKPGMRVLDVGCGQDQMMTKVLCASLSHVPKLWVGVDHGSIAKKSKMNWSRVVDEFDFTKRWKELVKPGTWTQPDGSKAKETFGPFDVVTCFEVIEHMPKAAGRKLLEGIHGVLAKDGVALLSTPNYNEKHMAANHIHEYRHDELRQEIERADFRIERVVGTFMTSQAIKRVATKEHQALVKQLHEAWYCWDVLANFLAPLYPEAASNCCWILKRK